MGTEHTKNSYADLIKMSGESTVSVTNKIGILIEKAFKEVEP